MDDEQLADLHRFLAEYHRKLAKDAVLDVIQQYHSDLAQRLADEAALIPRRTAIAQLEASVAGHRADFEHERERADRLMAELLQATAEATAAREATARLEGEVAVLRTRARTDSSIDQTERRLGQLAATLVDADRKAARG